MKVGIIGYGWVGKAMHDLFPDAMIYSHDLILREGEWFTNGIDWADDRGHYMDLVNACDVTFICVPTPNVEEGVLDTSIVEESIAWCKSPLLVVRSTVNPGDCNKWSVKYSKHIIMQPEYLGETVNHPMSNQKEREFVVIGGREEDRKKLMDLYTSVYNANTHIRQVTSFEAEVIKLTENRAIAFKVAQCQELYDVCQKVGLDYYTIRDAVYGDDPRFNLWWTFVLPEKRGFHSKCIPKDVYAWCAWAESLNCYPEITRAILEKNKEWISK